MRARMRKGPRAVRRPAGGQRPSRRGPGSPWWTAPSASGFGGGPGGRLLRLIPSSTALPRIPRGGP
eukprot:5297208-Alexandrium_andersonii.AAC.1